MNVRTRQPAAKTTPRRFGRHDAAAHRGGRGPAGRAVHRPAMNLRRRPPEKTTEKALGRLKAMLPGTDRATKTGRGGAGGAKGKAGLAALAGATAFAAMNWDKVTGLFSRGRTTATDTTPAVHPPDESDGDELQSAA